MLIRLKLKNVALIEIIEINFEKGLNILTGDSGSGKSLILDSLNVLFGGTNIPLNHLIRPGKDECLIEAKFTISPEVNNWLIKNGFNQSSPDLEIKRYSFKKNSKVITKYTVNDSSINKILLNEIAFLLFDFAGQSDCYLFDSAESRRSIIDDLGSKEFKELNFKIKNIWKENIALKLLMREKIESSKKQEEKMLEMKEMYRMLDQANLNSRDEIFDLKIQEKKIANKFLIKECILSLLNNLNNINDEDHSVSFTIGRSIKQISKIVEFDKLLAGFKDKLLNIQNDLEGLIFDLNTYIQDQEEIDMSLGEIQNRLFFLKNLERTFSLDLPQLIEKRDTLKKYFFTKKTHEEIKHLENKINNSNTTLNSLFVAQSSKRKQIANKLEFSVISLLEQLGLENAKFSIKFEAATPSEDGIDNIKFLFSANPDQVLAPISKVISGGEMSRFLLAFKSSISKQPHTFFLDEVDNGLSGKSLFSLVELIKTISKEKQVICITHQPILAAAANTHYRVKKNVFNGSTFTSIDKLSTKKERQNELIELIGAGFGEANDYASILLKRSAA